MIYPANLEKGFNIGVTATSDGFEGEVDFRRLNNAIKHFEGRGYQVITTPNVRTSDKKGRSSDARTRAKEMLDIIKDPKIRAIFAASGGDFLVEMLSYLDYEALKDNPKWVQGFSDTTGLTYTITTILDMATIYSYNFSTFGMENWHRSLSDNLLILEGNDIVQSSYALYQDGYYDRVTGIEEFVLEKEVEWKNLLPKGENDDNHEINIQGRMLGGCLDVLQVLVGTRFDNTARFIEKYRDDGILWFLESFDLNSESMVRALWQLKEAGWFKNARGFIFGRPALYKSDYEISYEETVYSVLGELGLPIILEADIGHKHPQFTIINGALATVKCKNKKGTIIFERR
ncbi:MAG: LD-carboxypeptidase [Anaerolineaceae bacterium]|nr:MAG: LD-carboxypeptidase [Anaerolineaceae bacterium]